MLIQIVINIYQKKKKCRGINIGSWFLFYQYEELTIISFLIKPFFVLNITIIQGNGRGGVPRR